MTDTLMTAPPKLEPFKPPFRKFKETGHGWFLVDADGKKLKGMSGDDADWLCARLSQSSVPGVDAEWVLVPREPTEEMVDAVTPKESEWIGHTPAPPGSIGRWQVSHASLAVKNYRAMLSAAPKPTEHSGGEWTEKERAAIDALMKDRELSERQIIRQALALYQMHTTRLNAGETCTYSGDAQRIRDFAGDLIPTTPPSGDERAAFEAAVCGKCGSASCRELPPGKDMNGMPIVRYGCRVCGNRWSRAKDALRAKHTSGPHSPAPGLSEEEREQMVQCAHNLAAEGYGNSAQCLRAILSRLTAAEPKAREGKDGKD